MFGVPIAAAETIARYLGQLVVALRAALKAKRVSGRRLDRWVHRVNNVRQAIRAGTARPIHDIKRMTRLLQDEIETIDPGFGIGMIALAAEPLAEPLAACLISRRDCRARRL